jgi:outer membrane lipoprotein-sorting protein
MQKIKAYLLNPANWVAFCVFIFWLGWVRASSNARLSALEEKCHEVDTVKAQMYEIQASLAQIQTDINRIRAAIQK